MRLKRLTVVLALLAVGAGTVIFWHNRQAPEPDELFYRALETNLRADAVTCTITDTAADSVTSQSIVLDLGSRANLRAVTTVKQTDTSVSTEQLANKTDEYVRYTSINTSRKNPSGQTPDFSKLLNIWSKSSLRGQQATLFGRTALGNCVVPLAHLSSKQLKPISRKLRTNTIFATDFAASKLATQDGNSVRVYDITIRPRPYIDFMKQIAVAYGRKDLDVIKAAEYEKKQPEKMKISIAVGSGQLQRVQYDASKRTIDFTDYGKVPRLVLPKQTVTPQQLQARFQPADNSKL